MRGIAAAVEVLPYTDPDPAPDAVLMTEVVVAC